MLFFVPSFAPISFVVKFLHREYFIRGIISMNISVKMVKNVETDLEIKYYIAHVTSYCNPSLANFIMVHYLDIVE